jgi:beta-glucosidase
VKDSKAALKRPEKELKAFEKVVLHPGETRTVTFNLSNEDLRYFDEKKNKWVFEPGEFQILVGSSAADIRINKKITL